MYYSIDTGFKFESILVSCCENMMVRQTRMLCHVVPDNDSDSNIQNGLLFEKQKEKEK